MQQLGNNKRELVAPIRIVKSENTEYMEDLLFNESKQIAFRQKTRATIKSGGYVILDYGKELSGGVRPICRAIVDENGNLTSATLHFRFGESLTESCSTLGVKNAGNDHSMRDFYASLATNSMATYGDTGFRFLRIDNTSPYDIVLAAIPAVNDYYSGVQLGTFECDDNLLNKIFETAAYTLSLCIQNGYIWDGIKRDRAVWIGDMYPEVMSSLYLYGNIEEIKNSIEFCKNVTPDGEWMNGIPSYSLWWIIVLSEYVKYTEDKEYAIANLSYVKTILTQFDGCLTSDGRYTAGNYVFVSKNENFLDWPTNFTPDSEFGVRALMLRAFRTAKALYKNPEIDILCDTLIERVQKRNKFVSSYKQVVAMRVLAGLESGEETLKLLTKDNAKGLSSFMSYFILSAIAQLGETGKALEIAKEYYGGMLSMGATTFWEDFDVDWMRNSARLDEFPKEGQNDIHGDFGQFCYKQFRHSFCHAWSVGIIQFLYEQVLGVQISNGGFKKVKIKPYLGEMSYVKGSIPTPYGRIFIECKKNANGEIFAKYSAPKEVEILLECTKEDDL